MRISGLKETKMLPFSVLPTQTHEVEERDFSEVAKTHKPINVLTTTLRFFS